MKRNISLDFNFLCPPLEKEQWDIFQKLIVNLSDSQKIWLSGYLYGITFNCNNAMFNSCNVSSVVNDNQSSLSAVSSISRPIITVLSASQTGNARELAKKLYHTLINERFNVNLFSISDYNVKKISREKLLFFVISTYGEGEPPEEALELHKYLFSNKPPEMKNIYFSVFGLGDRSYEHFSKAAKDFDVRLEELGGCRLLQRVDADIDYEKDAEDWRKNVVCVLKKEFMIFNLEDKVTNFNLTNTVSDGTNRNSTSVQYSSNIYTKETPFSARLLVRQKITSCNSVKDVYHLEIDLSGSKLCYQPGDALGVWYENDPDLIDELLKYCNFTGKEEIVINQELLPLSMVLKQYYELTHNTSWVAKKYAALIDQKRLLSLVSDYDSLKSFVSSYSIIDMIRCWPPKQLSPRQLLSVLRSLTPRFYSISSSQKEVGEEVHITVGMVRYKVDDYVRTGGASGYLIDRLSEGDEVRIFVLPNESFRLPINSNISIIMIAAGTGIAPFRSFMQERSLDGSSGKNWLFFGNLCFLDDFLYQCEWQRYVRDGVLTKIDTAWSRDQENKIYVQDKILQNGLEVWQWIKNGAYIYVCGNASHMAKNVEKTLIQLGIEYGKMSFEESNAFIGEMRIGRRYQKDVY